MRTKVSRISVVLLVAMAVALGLTPAHDGQPAPSKAPVEVTYYFLPG